MRWSRTLQLVDVHCEGEIGRVVTGGVLDVPGETVAAKLHHINTVDDSLRRLLTLEPRGGPAGSAVLLTPPTRPEADVGLIILQADQAHAMSGSNAMCAATALLETGMIEMREPETVVTFDTAAGLVRAVATCRGGRCLAVSLDMPPAFVEDLDATAESESFGALRYDLCFGGVFYALVDVQQLGLEIVPGSARPLAEAGMALHSAIESARAIRHPEIPELAGLAYVMFRQKEADGVFRTCTTLRPGRLDRSPCGTGSSANLAALHARRQTKPGDIWISRSIIGGEFKTEFVATTTVARREATAAKVTGRCWLYGLSQVGVDPDDPFAQGFLLSDTWGPMADQFSKA